MMPYQPRCRLLPPSRRVGGGGRHTHIEEELVAVLGHDVRHALALHPDLDEEFLLSAVDRRELANIRPWLLVMSGRWR
jgi:hypothetical protein